MPNTTIGSQGLDNPLLLNTVSASSSTVSGTQNIGGNLNLTSNNDLNLTSGDINLLGTAGTQYVNIPFVYNNDTTASRWQFYGNQWKLLGFFQLRDGGQYLDVKTNITANSCMYMFHVCGYLYNQGEVISYTSGYTYTPPSSILNQYTHNLGNQSISSYRTAGPAGGGSLCVKVNRGTSSYSEGQLAVYFHSHDTSLQNSCAVTAWSQNTNSGNFYTS
jgi:hypothetical protein